MYSPSARRSFAIPSDLKDAGLMLEPERIDLQFFGRQLGSTWFVYADRHVSYPQVLGMPALYLPLKKDRSVWYQDTAGIRLRLESFRLAGYRFGLANWSGETGDHAFYISGESDTATIATFLAIVHSMSEEFQCPREFREKTNTGVRIYQRGERLIRCVRPEPRLDSAQVHPSNR
jgi:hypothetical protein